MTIRFVLLALASALLQQAPATGDVTLTATSTNVGQPGNPVRIHILRWSTDDERSALTAAMRVPAPTATSPAPAATGPAPTATSPTPSATGPAPAEGAAGAARGGRSGAAGRGAPAGRGRGARGAGRGDAPLGPIAALTGVISRAETIGYIWTNDVTGYAIKYAWRAPLADGDRILLATDRRFGGNSIAWTLANRAPSTDYTFTVFELRLDSSGSGQGKTSLTTTVVLDSDANTIALGDYDAAPAILVLRNARTRTSGSQ
jgi:hypothetical protein